LADKLKIRLEALVGHPVQYLAVRSLAHPLDPSSLSQDTAPPL
jgi:hypothetical protein